MSRLLLVRNAFFNSTHNDISKMKLDLLQSDTRISTPIDLALNVFKADPVLFIGRPL